MLEFFKFCKTREVKSPTRGTEEAAGIDFFVPSNLTKEDMRSKLQVTECNIPLHYNDSGYLQTIILKPNHSVLIPSGIHIKLEKGYCLKFENKSGIAARKHIICGSAVVDSDYEGEIHLNLHNIGNNDVEINAGDKVIQGIIYKVELPEFAQYESLESLYKDSSSKRGIGGFGSTGVK